jgi:LacI family transcriptional regulator
MSPRVKTLKDLATRLDVSVATVSRALAGHDRIALKTRERVAEAARELGYTPNRAARALVSGRSGFAGLALPIRGSGQDDAFVGPFVSGLTEGFAAAGVDLFLSAVPEGKSELAVIRNIVETHRADGLVLARVAEEDPRVDYLIKQGFPFVAQGRLWDESRPFNWIDTDGDAAFAEAFDLLYGLGHRRFGFVTITEAMTFRRHRAAGLEGAIARRGDPHVRLDTVAAPRFDTAARAAAIRRLFDRPERPTAILGLTDEIAIAVIEEAGRIGLSAPADFSVIGFGDIPASALSPVSLTTFDSGIHASAVEVAELLVALIDNPDMPCQNRLICPRLLKRATHGPAPRRG